MPRPALGGLSEFVLSASSRQNDVEGQLGTGVFRGREKRRGR
jgi:hypothetical protein